MLKDRTGKELGVEEIVKKVIMRFYNYFLDYEIRKTTAQTKSLTDALVYWRNHLPIEFTNDDMLQELNTCIGEDFTDFFNRYFYGTERFPVELDWYYRGD